MALTPKFFLHFPRSGIPLFQLVLGVKTKKGVGTITDRPLVTQDNQKNHRNASPDPSAGSESQLEAALSQVARGQVPGPHWHEQDAGQPQKAFGGGGRCHQQGTGQPVNTEPEQVWQDKGA